MTYENYRDRIRRERAAQERRSAQEQSNRHEIEAQVSRMRSFIRGALKEMQPIDAHKNAVMIEYAKRANMLDRLIYSGEVVDTHMGGGLAPVSSWRIKGTIAGFMLPRCVAYESPVYIDRDGRGVSHYETVYDDGLLAVDGRLWRNSRTTTAPNVYLVEASLATRIESVRPETISAIGAHITRLYNE